MSVLFGFPCEQIFCSKHLILNRIHVQRVQESRAYLVGLLITFRRFEKSAIPVHIRDQQYFDAMISYHFEREKDPSKIDQFQKIFESIIICT